MNTGQTLITLGALTLLMITIINMNRTINENNEILNNTRFGLETVAIATSIIEEASQLAFDEVSWDSTKLEKDIADFTLSSNLGPEYGEFDYATFDDFDDFNNYTKTENTLQNIYDISCQICYIEPSDLENPTSSRTYYKKLIISITNPFNTVPFQMSYIHGYWYYN